MGRNSPQDMRDGTIRSIEKHRRRTMPSIVCTRHQEMPGFTYIEVMVALLVTVILVAAVTSVLITAGRVQRTAQHLQEAQLLIRRVATEHRLGVLPPRIDAAWSEGWKLHAAHAETMQTGPVQVTWSTYHCTPDNQPQLVVSIDLIDAVGDTRVTP